MIFMTQSTKTCLDTESPCITDLMDHGMTMFTKNVVLLHVCHIIISSDRFGMFTRVGTYTGRQEMV